MFSSPYSPISLGLKYRPFVTYFIPVQEGPVLFLKFQRAPRIKIIMFYESKNKEPTYVCLSDAESSGTHTHTQTRCGTRFRPLLHISYIRDYLSVPSSADVFSGCYVP